MAPGKGPITSDKRGQMKSSNYANANHVTPSCNLTHLIYGAGEDPPSSSPTLGSHQPQTQIPATQASSEHGVTVRQWGSGETGDKSKKLFLGGAGCHDSVTAMTQCVLGYIPQVQKQYFFNEPEHVQAQEVINMQYLHNLSAGSLTLFKVGCYHKIKPLHPTRHPLERFASSTGDVGPTVVSNFQRKRKPCKGSKSVPFSFIALFPQICVCI